MLRLNVCVQTAIPIYKCITAYVNATKILAFINRKLPNKLKNGSPKEKIKQKEKLTDYQTTRHKEKKKKRKRR